jgi:hypothetical protein
MQVKTGITAAFNIASPKVLDSSARAAVTVGIGQLNSANLSGSGLDIVTQINVGTGIGIATVVAVSVNV